MADTAIRDGSAADIGAVMAVMADAFPPEYGEAWNEAQCAGMLALPGTGLVLAEDKGGAARGFAIVRVIGEECELLMLAVARDARREGIGRCLCRHVMATATDLHCTKIFLEVRDGNEAILLYTSLGFNGIGRRPSYYRGASGCRFDALTFARSL